VNALAAALDGDALVESPLEHAVTPKHAATAANATRTERRLMTVVVCCMELSLQRVVYASLIDASLITVALRAPHSCAMHHALDSFCCNTAKICSIFSDLAFVYDLGAPGANTTTRTNKFFSVTVRSYSRDSRHHQAFSSIRAERWSPRETFRGIPDMGRGNSRRGRGLYAA
jgi:hypothetical protein